MTTAPISMCLLTSANTIEWNVVDANNRARMLSRSAILYAGRSQLVRACLSRRRGNLNSGGPSLAYIARSGTFLAAFSLARARQSEYSCSGLCCVRVAFVSSRYSAAGSVAMYTARHSRYIPPLSWRPRQPSFSEWRQCVLKILGVSRCCWACSGGWGS